MRPGAYPVIGSTSVLGYHDEFKVEPPGVMTGRSGSLGFVQYVPVKYWPHNTSLWVRDFKGNHPRYVYYYLQTLDLQRFNSGTGVPTLNRNDLDTLELWVHRLPTQRKIAAVLSAYDDLIENNTRRIQILDEMARAIYREWFIHFRFPGHETVKMVESALGVIPEGWEVKRLADLVETQYGYTESAREDEVGPKFVRGTDINKNCLKMMLRIMIC
jgi:type I restriction enzyme S subunit